MPKSNQKRKGVRDGEFVDLGPDEIDYVLDNNDSLAGPTLNLAPLQNAVSSQRLFYASRFFSQADPLEDPDEPWVQNQAADGQSFDEKMGRRAGAIESPFDGVIREVTANRIKGENAEGEPFEVPLYDHFSLNRKNQFHQSALVKPGDRVNKGQVLTKSNFTNDRGTLAIGRNARVGVVPYLGYSMDDATVISESFANRLKSDHLMDFETDDSHEDVIRSKNHFRSVFPQLFTTDQLDKLADNGVVKPGTELQKGDPITIGSLPPRVREEDRQKGAFGKYLRNRRRDISETWKYDEPGVVRDVVQRKDGSYAVSVETKRPAKLSDKLVSRSGAKFTISKIVPDEEMPRTKDGEPFEILANPLGIPCFDSETEILTDKGWKRVDQIDDSYRFMTLNPDTFDMEWQRAEEVHHYDYKGPMYHMETRQLDIMVTPDHRQFSIKRGERITTEKLDVHRQDQREKFDLTPARDVVGQPRQYLKAARWKGGYKLFKEIDAGSKGKTGKCRPGFSFEISLWAEFMGWFLSEGYTCVNHGKKGDSYITGICQCSKRNPAHYAEIKDLLDNMGINYCMRPKEFVISHKGLYEYLSQFGKARDKWIPRDILDLPPALLGIFLTALMAGDGTNYTNHKTGHENIECYTSSSKRLLDGVQEIYAKLGRKVNIKRENRRGEQACYYAIIQKASPGAWVNANDLQKESETEEWVDYDGQVHCVTVPNGIVFVRRNGKAVFSGNSRQNPAFLMELLLGKVAAKRGEPMKFPSFNDPDKKWTETVKELLDEEGLSDTEDVWDPVAQRYLENPITTGNMHLLKLMHQSEGKMSARGTGGYTQWEQPRKGGDEMGQSGRLSGLELSGLLSAGAYNYIKDGSTVRGQKSDEYWRALRSGQTPAKPGQPFAWDRTKALLHGSGYMLRDQGQGTTRLGPLTDLDAERFKAEELSNADMIDYKTGKPIPGGLFDESRAITNRWGKISLDYPLPNPAFETPLLKLLGLKKKDMENIIAGEQELEGYGTGSEALYKKLKDIDPQSLKEEMIGVVKSGVKTKRPRAIDVLNTLSGLERNKIAPHELMVTQVPVIPSRFRPFSFQGDTFLPGDVNELYGDVFRLRNQNRDLFKTLGESAAGEHRMDVYDGMRALYGTRGTRNRKLSEKGIDGFLKQTLGKSPKYSVFQRNLFSKTVDGSGRGVAGLDPTLGIDEVGIPRKMAWKLYAPYVQRRLVKSGMSPADALRAVDAQGAQAESALREELASRPGVLNRSPAWHKFNSTGAFFRLHDGPNIQVNPLIAPGHNLDYNGDQNIGYVVLCGLKSVFKESLNYDLTKAVGMSSIQNMFNNIDIPAINADEEVCIVNLGDFPKGDFIRTKQDGKNGPIDFYKVPEGIKVVAFDETTFKPKWAPVSQYSVHPNREVEIVNLSNDLQIITDDDPRAVYGIDPTTPGFHLERFTPTEAKKRGVLAARVHTTHGVFKPEGYMQHVKFASNDKHPLDADFGYFLGAMAGDGWTDAKETSNCFYIADLPGSNTARIKAWLESFNETVNYRTVESFKEEKGRYGDTVKHCFFVPENGKHIAASLKKMIGGEGDALTTGSGNKHLPAFAASAPLDFVHGMLAGLLDTDGTICNTQAKGKKHTQLAVTVASTSLQLLRDAKFLFDLLGICGRISFSKVTTKGNKCWILSLHSADTFKRLGPIVAQMQSQQKVGAFHKAHAPNEEASSTTRMDMLPMTDSFYKAFYPAVPSPKRTSQRMADPEVAAEVKELNSLKVAVGNSFRRSKRVPRNLVKRLLHLISENNKWLQDKRVDAMRDHPEFNAFMLLYLAKDIRWLAVESVEYTGKCETGYDLTVPGYETFMNSDGVILSNTLGVFVPSLPEAVEDVKNKLMPSKQIFSIRDPEKVVNSLSQDLLLGLYNAATHPSRKTHVFETREDAMRAIQQGRVSLSDEVKINDEPDDTPVQKQASEKEDDEDPFASIDAAVERRKKDGILKEPIDLPDGRVKGKRYGYTVEIDGVEYESTEGTRCIKKYCGPPQEFIVEDGKLFFPHDREDAENSLEKSE